MNPLGWTAALLAFAVLVACSAFGSDDASDPSTTADDASTADGGELCPAEEPDAGGATEALCDGSTIPVELSSNTHCGSCTRDCLGNQCVQARCQPFDLAPAEPPSYPAAQLTARDSQHVYWVHEDTVRAMPSHQTGTPTVIAKRTDADAGEGTFLKEIQVDQTYGFVRAADGIFRFPLQGGDGTLSKLRIDGYAYVRAFAIDAQVIYSTDVNRQRILRMSKDGTGTTEIVPGHRPLGPIVADGTFVFWLDGGEPDAGMGAAVARTNPQGSEVSLLAKGLGNPTSLAMDATYVYWADSATRQIARVPKRGGAVMPITTAPVGPVTALAVDDQHVYWLAPDTAGANSQTLSKASKCGGGTTILATTLGAQNFVVDDAYVFLAQYERPFLRIRK